MKKNIFSLTFFILLMIFMTGCEQKVDYVFLDNSEKIEKIEIVEVGEMEYIGNKLSSSLQPEIIVVKELSKDNISSFLKDFNELECYKYLTDPGYLFPGSEAIKISYLNGDYELINVEAQGRFKNNKYIGTGRFYFDDEPFNELIDKYANLN